MKISMILVVTIFGCNFSRSAHSQIAQQKITNPNASQNPIRATGTQERPIQTRSTQSPSTMAEKQKTGSVQNVEQPSESGGSRSAAAHNPSLPAYLQGNYHQLPLLKPDNLDFRPLKPANLRTGGALDGGAVPQAQNMGAETRSSLYSHNPVLTAVYTKVEVLKDLPLSRIPVYFGTSAIDVHASSAQSAAAGNSNGTLSHSAYDRPGLDYPIRENGSLAPGMLVFTDNSPKRWENFVQIPEVFGTYRVIAWGTPMGKSERDAQAERFVLGSYTGLGSLIGGRLGALSYANSLTHVPKISNVNQYADSQLGINVPGVRNP